MKTFFLILLSASLSFAQTIRIAPVLGPNVTFSNFSKTMKDYYSSNYFDQIDGTVKTSFPPSIRIQFGGLVEYSVNNSLSLQSGLLVTFRGFNLKMKGSISDVYEGDQTFKAKSKMKVSYLEIPLWASYRIGETGFRITAGPSFGFAIGGKTTASISYDGDTDSDSESLHIGNDADTDDLRPIDVSFNIAVSKEITIADKPFEISVYAQPSISKWNPQNGVDPEFFIRHFTSGVRVAWFLPLKQ